MAGLCLILAGVFGLVPLDGRIAWVCVLLAGVFILVPFPIHG